MHNLIPLAALTHIPLGLEVALYVLLGLIALGGSAFFVKGIFDSAKNPQEDAEAKPEYDDVWAPFEAAHKRYEEREIPDAKPMSILDWLARRQY